ncbi:MAG: MFS transporter [Actinomycetota bacterium]
MGPVYLSVFFFMVGESALHVIVPPYLLQELGLGPALIGTLAGAFGFASLLARMPVGAIYRLRRARLLLLAGGGCSALAFAAVPLVDGALPFGVIMALDGVGWSVATTTQLAVLVAARPKGLSTTAAMGWYSGFTGLGHTTAGALGGFMADRLGFDLSFVSLALLTALGTAILVRMVGRVMNREESTEPSRVPIEARGWGRETWRGVASMPAIVWAGVLVMAYINLVNGLVRTFHPVIALQAGLSLTQIGILASCRSWASSSVRLGSGPIFSRVGAHRLTTPLVFLAAGSVLLIPTFRASFVLQVPLFLMMGMSRGLLRVTGSADAFDGARDEDRQHGLVAALLHSGLDVGRVGGPLVGGIVAQFIGLPAMFRVVPLALLALYFPLALAARRAGVRRLTAEDAERAPFD